MNRKKRRAVFTLVELLLLITILGLLVTLVVLNFPGGGDGTRERKVTTLTSIDAISKACDIYRMKTGRLPRNIEDLTNGINDEKPLLKAGALNDDWGIPFEYKTEGKKYSIRSAGPDGAMNTEDDLTN